MQCGILETGLVLVAAVAQLERLVLVVGLVLERCEGEECLVTEFLLGLNLEGTRVVCHTVTA